MVVDSLIGARLISERHRLMRLNDIYMCDTAVMLDQGSVAGMTLRRQAFAATSTYAYATLHNQPRWCADPCLV